jgi:Cu/Ag efflux protein CusF
MLALYAVGQGRRYWGKQCAVEVVNWSVIRALFASSLLALLLIGCHSSQKENSAAAANPVYKVYKLRGKVVSTNAATGEVTLNHEAIPGFMEAMTMPYRLKDPSILGELHPGDVITADVLVSQRDDADVLLDHIVVVAQGKPDYKPAIDYHVPAPGDAVPDFALRNQDGNAIHLGQYRGKELLITFIYTRCPMPNFCPQSDIGFCGSLIALGLAGYLGTGSHAPHRADSRLDRRCAGLWRPAGHQPQREPAQAVHAHQRDHRAAGLSGRSR